MADIKIAYGSSAALTITLASLATSSTLVAGRESTAVSNTSALVLDYLIGGKITTGTSPSAGRIEIWLYGELDDTPTYPDVFDGTDSAETVTSADIKFACLYLVNSLVTSSSSDVTYWFAPTSVAQLFGGALPKSFGAFVTQNTTVNLNATGSNHAIWVTPVYATAT